MGADVDGERRAELEVLRARALARDRFGLVPDEADVAAAPFGACVRAESTALVVTSSADLAALGGVLVWSDRHAVTSVDLVVEHHAGVHARRAAVIAPEMRVWDLVGDTVERAVGEPLPEPVPAPVGVEHLVELIERVGADPVLEAGIVRAELAGLEVGRIVAGPDGPELQAGVGRFDREAGALLHAGRPAESALSSVVEQLHVHRRPGALAHAASRIGRERWIRHAVMGNPGIAGVRDPERVEPIPPTVSVREPAPASLLAHDGDISVLVVCSVGADLGLVPATVDLLIRHGADEVRFVLPERDLLPHLARLAARLPYPHRPSA